MNIRLFEVSCKSSNICRAFFINLKLRQGFTGKVLKLLFFIISNSDSGTSKRPFLNIAGCFKIKVKREN